MNIGEQLVFPRYNPLVRTIMTLVLVGFCAFAMTMAALVSHDSELRCEPGGMCTHLERYPFGIERRASLTKIARAGVEWSPGGRSQALKLVLTHEDGSFTDYLGVGKNGERAERTAKAINAFLENPTPAATFALREGSLPVAIFLALLGFGALLFVPSFFTRVVLSRPSHRVRVRIGRWPAPNRELELESAEFTLRVTRNSLDGLEFFTVESGGHDLGMSFFTEKPAKARVDLLNGSAPGTH